MMSVKLTKKEQASIAKAKKNDVKLGKMFDSIINQLQNTKPNDTYRINDLFSKAYNLTQYEDIDCDTTPLLDNIEEGQPLMDTLEDDLGSLNEMGVDSGKPTEEQAEKAGDIGTESVESRQRKLDFVENNFIRGLNWFISDDDYNVTFLDKDTAITTVKEFKQNATVIPAYMLN